MCPWCYACGEQISYTLTETTPVTFFYNQHAPRVEHRD